MNLMQLRGMDDGADPAGPDSAGASAASWRSPEQPPRLIYYFTMLRRHKWVILGSVVGGLVLGLVFTLLATPLYTAVSTLEIQRETRNFTMVQGANANETSNVDLEFYQTQYGLLRSRALAERVATGLRLHDSPQFFGMFKEARVSQWFEGGRVRADAAPREVRIREAADLLLHNLVVSPERLSRLVNISFGSPDPAFSKQVVDTWGADFIRSTLERRFGATAYARRFLEGRLAELRGRIDTSERRLVDYAARESIITLPSTTATPERGGAMGERSLLVDDLAAINRERSEATAARIAAQSRLGARGDLVNEALQNDAIGGLRQRRAELASDYARMMVQFEPEYPPARALQTQLEQIDRSIAREESRVRQTLRQTYDSAVSREQQLDSRVGQLQTGVLDLRRRSIQYNIYQRDVDTSRQLYDALLQRYKEIGVAGGVGVNNISIVDPAELPRRPSSPKFLLNMLLALIAGTVVGVGIAFGIEQIDQGVSDPGEVENLLGVPLIGTIPKVTQEQPIDLLADRKSTLAEAYLSLQTSLAFSTDHGVPRTLAVTSTRPAEGKTTTSYALALSIARTGKRVLLVDGDMRSPSLHNMLNIDHQTGLSNFLAGNDEVASLIVPTQFEGLSVMSAGPLPPSSPELLSSDRLQKLIEILLQSYDHILFDAPPVMGLADAPLLASRVEGVIFVVEYHATQKAMARVALGRLRSANAQILGAVVTKFNAKRAQYGYGYDYGYGHDYGAKASA